MRNRRQHILAIILIFILVIGAGEVVLVKNIANKSSVTINKYDKYQLFVGEVYDKIKANYWETITDKDLSNLFLLAAKKVTSTDLSLNTQDKNGVLQMVKMLEKKDTISTTVDMVLANLMPFGRSRLYSLKEEKALTNTVNNVDPASNLSETLGIGKSATDKEVATAYEKKLKEVKTPEQKAAVVNAYKVLKNEDSRKIYEISGVEPTIEYKLLSPDIYYVHMTKFSPTSLDEFVRVMDKVKDKSETLDTLIFDLRGNIGGAIDGLPYFLGPFIGPDTYAYQFYQQGKKEDFKTLTGWLPSMVRYKKVVVLIDEYSQSTAELMASSLKKYNVGVVVGKTTKGWGTVEKVLQIDNQIASDEKFSLFLVHHVTIRDDGQPIEGRGVEPMISINDVNWKKELLRRFNSPEIVKAVETIFYGK